MTFVIARDTHGSRLRVEKCHAKVIFFCNSYKRLPVPLKANIPCKTMENLFLIGLNKTFEIGTASAKYAAVENQDDPVGPGVPATFGPIPSIFKFRES